MEDTHDIQFNASNKKVGRPKMRCVEVYPFFETREEAEGYRENNPDWIVVESTVLLEITN